MFLFCSKHLFAQSLPFSISGPLANSIDKQVVTLTEGEKKEDLLDGMKWEGSKPNEIRTVNKDETLSIEFINNDAFNFFHVSRKFVLPKNEQACSYRLTKEIRIGNIPQSKMSAIPDAANRFAECVTTAGTGSATLSLPELPGRHMVITLEERGKATLVSESAFFGNCAERKIGQFDPLNRLRKPQSLKIFAEADSECPDKTVKKP